MEKQLPQLYHIQAAYVIRTGVVKVLFRPGSPGTRCRVKKLVILFRQALFFFFHFEIIVTMRRHGNLKWDFGTSNSFTCPDDKEQKEHLLLENPVI